jgi:Rrf2 family nitric oxide-sensitive transcriptional repressor
MLNLTESYALRAVCFISLRGGVVRTKCMARELKIPRPYLEQILKSLARKGVLIGKRGRSGGYCLAREKSWTMIRHVLGKQGNRCLLGATRCLGHKYCSFMHICKRANRRLKKTSISLHACCLRKSEPKELVRE